MPRQPTTDVKGGPLIASPQSARLLLDAPAAGAWNMAVDEVLLDTAAEDGLCTLRFYEWSEPTLSLGYFQPFATRANHAASRNCPVVRRPSGGGAILHDAELTYCLAMPLAHPLAIDTTRLYSLVHESLTATLAQWQITARPLAAGKPAAAPAEPFLCFARRAQGDVVIEISSNAGPTVDHKICGSAQRRRRGAVVQHGSVLLARSTAAPELAGLAELTGVRLTPTTLSRAWQPQLSAALGLAWQPTHLSAAETERVCTLAIEKYDTNSWTRRR